MDTRRNGSWHVAWLVVAVTLSTRAGNLSAQSSFETDPFASRFRERANFDLKFKPPERGGFIRILVERGEPGGPQGHQTFVGQNIAEAEAAPGKFVLVEYQDIKLKARRVHADLAQKTVVAEGDVLLEQGKSRMTGARLDLDLADRVGVLTDGRVDLEGGLYLAGAVIAKVGPKSFTLTDGTVTSCEGEKPAWVFTVKSGRVTLDDYARLKGVVWKFEGVPALYTPYIVWPALRDRASGLLVPSLGYNSTRGGFLGLSYYWAIDRTADATFSTDLYSKGFYGLGVETRFRPSAGTTAEATYYTIHDPDLARWRWETRGSVVSNDLAPGVRAVVRWLDFSDQNFLQDFERNFDLSSARSVRSEAFATWSPDPLAFNLRLDREEAIGFSTVDPATGALVQQSVVSERRPVLEARLRPTPLFAQHVFLEGAAQVGELRAARGPGQPSGVYDRIDLFPKVSVPLSLVPWLSLQANAGLRLTSYGESLDETGTRLLPTRYNRRYVELGFEMTGPSFSRIFEASLGPYTRLKHVIEPRVDYDYLRDPGDFSRTPLFDEIDSIFGLHTLRYGVVQRLLGKGKQGGSREIASLEISRPYYFQLPGEGTPAGPSPTLTRNAPVDTTLRINGGANFNFDARATWDTHFNQVTAASLTATLAAAERSLSLSLFDSRPVPPPAPPGVTIPAFSSAQLRFGGGLPIIPKRLRLDVQGNYDLTEGRMLESRSLLTVEASCFKLLLEFRDLRIGNIPSRDFRLALNLKNVGSFLDLTGSLSR